MRLLLISVLFFAGETVSVTSSLRVDGIRVYGRLQDVSRADIREAIDANGPINKPRELEVVSSTEMHAFYETRELGWTPVRKLRALGPKKYAWTPMGLSVFEPQVLHLIRSADEVYVFPVPKPLTPHRDDKHLRLLDGDARKNLLHLIGDQRNWWQQAYHLVAPEPVPPDVGLLFRRGANEVVLFFCHGYVHGTINAQTISGLLEDMGEKLERWKERYAQTELHQKKV